MTPVDGILAEIDRAADEILQFTVDLVRIPTVNPPGDEYEACARFVGDHLSRRHFDVEYIVAELEKAGCMSARFDVSGPDELDYDPEPERSEGGEGSRRRQLEISS